MATGILASSWSKTPMLVSLCISCFSAVVPFHTHTEALYKLAQTQLLLTSVRELLLEDKLLMDWISSSFAITCSPPSPSSATPPSATSSADIAGAPVNTTSCCCCCHCCCILPLVSPPSVEEFPMTFSLSWISLFLALTAFSLASVSAIACYACNLSKG